MDDRFEQRGDEMEIFFVPQCCGCKFQKELYSCEKFPKKPNEYMENLVDCPYREEDDKCK